MIARLTQRIMAISVTHLMHRSGVGHHRLIKFLHWLYVIFLFMWPYCDDHRMVLNLRFITFPGMQRDVRHSEVPSWQYQITYRSLDGYATINLFMNIWVDNPYVVATVSLRPFSMLLWIILFYPVQWFVWVLTVCWADHYEWAYANLAHSFCFC